MAPIDGDRLPSQSSNARAFPAMIRVHITTINPDRSTGNFIVDLKRKMDALSQKCVRYEVVADPDAADLIMLDASFALYLSHVDRARHSIRSHPLRRERRDVCFAYDNDDHPCPLVPGASPSLNKRSWDPLNQRPAPYLHHLGNPLLDPKPFELHADHLYSFVGAPSTHPVRQRICDLQDTRALIIGTDARWPADRGARDAFKQRYADSIHQSKFVLCPRGRGTASIRLFEVLEAGRIPVVISDDWVAPYGPDWEAFSVRVPEADVTKIPSILRTLEMEAASMAAAARRAFTEWFSAEVVLDRLFDSLMELKDSRTHRPAMRTFGHLMKWVRPATIYQYALKPVARGILKPKRMKTLA